MIEKITNDPKWKFLVGIVGIISLIFVLAPGFYNLILYFRNTPKFLILLSPVFLIVLVFVLSQFRNIMKNWADLTTKIQEEKIEREIESINAQKDKRIEKFVPSNSQLKRWLEVASKRATRWSEDAQFLYVGFNIYHTPKLDIEPLMTLSFRFYSPWKKELINVIFGREQPVEKYEGLELPETHMGKPSFQGKASFLKGFRKWRDALKKSHRKLADRLVDNFTLHISLGTEIASFLYTYRIGKVEMRDFFHFDGKTLRHSRDNSETKI